MSIHYKLEVCANSIESVLEAQAGGADRIELCDNMAEGGTTPSFGTISLCKKLLKIPVFPIIRPRGGDFVYTVKEFEVMKRDILMCKDMACEGVVLGILSPDARVDMRRCEALIALAKPMQVTFHRAFDRCADLRSSLEDLIELGCDRVLTSGGKPKAPDAAVEIKGLVQQAAGRIVVMPGSGIHAANLVALVNETGAPEYHSTARRLPFDMANLVGAEDAAVPGTDRQQVSLMKDILYGLVKDRKL